MIHSYARQASTHTCCRISVVSQIRCCSMLIHTTMHVSSSPTLRHCQNGQELRKLERGIQHHPHHHHPHSLHQLLGMQLSRVKVLPARQLPKLVAAVCLMTKRCRGECLCLLGDQIPDNSSLSAHYIAWETKGILSSNSNDVYGCFCVHPYLQNRAVHLKSLFRFAIYQQTDLLLFWQLMRCTRTMKVKNPDDKNVVLRKLKLWLLKGKV